MADHKISQKRIFSFVKGIDFHLLLMLCTLVVDVIWIKSIALLISFFWMKKNDWIGGFKAAPPFYALILVFSCLQYLILQDFSKEYLIFFSIGWVYWLSCLLCFMVLYSRVKQKSLPEIDTTITAFFLINVVVTLTQLALAIYHSGSLNPYAIWDNPAFGNSTGDYLKGIFRAPCYINFFCCSFFAVYYLYKRQLILSFIAVVVLCLTSCNFSIIFFLPVYLLLCFLIKIPKGKLLAVSSLAFVIIFYGLISVGNAQYLAESFLKIERKLNQVQVEKINKAAGKKNSASTKDDIAFLRNKKGKVIAVQQTIAFVSTNPKNFLLGAGIGNFSSLLAQRQSDIQSETKSRLFKKLPTRVAGAYRPNHYTIERHVYNLPGDWHSIQHLPASFFNQILGEYGVIGTILFLVFYIGFILKRTKFKSFLFPIAILLGYYLLFDYLFEYLSIIVIFELFFIVYIKEKNLLADA